MTTATIRLLTLWKVAKGIESDHAAWQALGLSSQSAISNWRHGRSHAAAVVVDRMAREAGQDPGQWLAQVQADRATSSAEAKVWSSFARKLGAAAALGCIVALPAANVAQIVGNLPSLPIM